MDDKWFKAQQRRVGVTADDIAAKMGRTRANVSHILTGRQRMSLDWAKAFAEVLQQPLDVILEKAGVTDAPTAQRAMPGFSDQDASPWLQGTGMSETNTVKTIAAAMGQAAGIDVWRVNSASMALAGLLVGDFILVDTHQSERARAGDVVIAQVYNRTGAQTVLRRLEPPVLVAASIDPADGRVFVVDGENVVVRGKVVASWRI